MILAPDMDLRCPFRSTPAPVDFKELLSDMLKKESSLGEFRSDTAENELSQADILIIFWVAFDGLDRTDKERSSCPRRWRRVTATSSARSASLFLTCFFGAPAARLGGGVLFQRLPALRSRYRKFRAADEALHGEFAGMTFEVTDFLIDLFIVRLTATPEIGTDLQKGAEPLGRDDPPPPWCKFRRNF